MAAFRTLFHRQRSGVRRGADAAGIRHLEDFAQSRPGVEGFIEPQTAVTETTLVLVAGSGEWTRRRVPDAAAAFALGKRLSIPVYDVHLVGYPARMREWSRRGRNEPEATAS